MALPRHLKKALTPAEIEFLAECQTVVVAPSHRLPKLDLITSVWRIIIIIIIDLVIIYYIS